MTRKQNEREANQFDMDLYRLLDRARARADSADPFSDHWRTVMWALIDLRPTVRNMMSTEDRKVTS